MYIQDAPGAWNGIFVYLGTDINNLVGDSVIVAEGDSVTLTGTVDEYYNVTQIKDVTSLVVEEYGVGCYSPITVPTDSLNQEKYEGCLVRVKDVAVSTPDAGYGEWGVDDGSGEILIDDEGNAPYYFCACRM
ncbi:MAG: hypothetical protein U5N56_09880 [Candidatus Marinimicrobia bacterium]|nr:hypothetical protein [Candidatus Neomarinimicrobiota bacterium]